MGSQAASRMWKSTEARYNRVQPGASGSAVLSEGVEHLKLPPVGSHHKANSGKGQKKESRSLQTYEAFGSKAEKLNADVSFTKQLMDDTFQRAVLIATRYGRSSNKSGVNTAEINKVLTRLCLL